MLETSLAGGLNAEFPSVAPAWEVQQNHLAAEADTVPASF
jgi:hypothetical protein